MPTKIVDIPEGYLKADLHCHTFYSGKTDRMTAFEPMDSCSTPQQLYQLAKKRGMDLVTITNHDSIDGCLSFLEKVFFSGALGGLTVRYWIEKFRQKDYERLIEELRPAINN
jgi:hypothetical protein